MKKRNYKPELDLHGKKHDRVRHLLIREIEKFWGTDTELRIITGHSESMKKIVRTILNEYSLNYQEGDIINPGYIKTFVW